MVRPSEKNDAASPMPSHSAQAEHAHILVVDDDPRVRTMLARYFEGEGFRVSLAEDGTAMRQRMANSTIDLVFLDLVLSGEDGLRLATELRSQSDVGIIMLTGRGDMVDRVIGLEIGADDYIPKPFELREVLARAKSVLRRRRPSPATGPDREDELLTFEGWRLDLGRRELLSPEGEEVPLTTGEFNLLTIFLRHPGRVLDRDQLMSMSRGREWEALDRTIDAQVSRVRKKLERDPGRPQLIKSVRGVGYLFAGKVSRHPPA
jgi:two-component system phosphate regulon response regulator OmpR